MSRVGVVATGVVLLLGSAARKPALAAGAALDECLLPHITEQDGQKSRSSKWWSSDEGRAEFGLSDAQTRDLEAVFQQVMPTLHANKADVDRYQKELTRLLSEASAKESVVLQAIDQLESAQSALSRTRTIMLYRMYRLLRPEQRVKVQAYYERKAKEPAGQSTRR